MKKLFLFSLCFLASDFSERLKNKHGEYKYLIDQVSRGEKNVFSGVIERLGLLFSTQELLLTLEQSIKSSNKEDFLYRKLSRTYSSVVTRVIEMVFEQILSTKGMDPEVFTIYTEYKGTGGGINSFLEGIILNRETKEELVHNLQKVLATFQRTRKKEVLLMLGGPGVGKTLTINSIYKAFPIGTVIRVIHMADLMSLPNKTYAVNKFNDILEEAAAKNHILILEEAEQSIISRLILEDKNKKKKSIKEEEDPQEERLMRCLNALMLHHLSNRKITLICCMNTSVLQYTEETISRRFSNIILFDNPNVFSRKLLWKYYLPDYLFSHITAGSYETQMQELANLSKNLTGRDISQIATMAFVGEKPNLNAVFLLLRNYIKKRKAISTYKDEELEEIMRDFRLKMKMIS